MGSYAAVLFMFVRRPSRSNLAQQRRLVDKPVHCCSNMDSCLNTGCASLFQICLKGKVHIFKYLNIQACRMDKKPDTLDLPSLGKRCLPQPLTDR